MGVFDNIEIVNGQVVVNQWMEWVHWGIPNEMGVQREFVRYTMLIIGHCLICTQLDGCYFVERKMPKRPQHEKCDCFTLKKGSEEVKGVISANCDIKKFTEYIFGGHGGKRELFESWGFSVEDSSMLKYEFEEQAKRQYSIGNYELKNLDRFGQRIAIPISLNGQDFYSGWLVCPNGYIKNTTPFGGWIK